MDELAVTRVLLETVLETAGQTSAARITAIDLVIGELSRIESDSVRDHFERLCPGTAAAGAALHIRHKRASASCRDCGHQFPLSPPWPAVCPACHRPHLQITGGRAFFVEKIEVEEGDPTCSPNPASRRTPDQ